MKEQNLSYIFYRPETEAEAVVFCVHGMQEHKMRYDAFAKYLNENGIACITYDLPGHGKSAKDGKPGYFSDQDGWKTLVNSAVEIAKMAKEEYPDLPLIYFGHSMGTIIGRVFLQEHDDLVDGCILCGIPCYQSACRIGILLAKTVVKMKGKDSQSKFLENLATGAFNKVIDNPETDVDWLSYNKNNVQDYINDELCGVPFTSQGYLDLFTLMSKMGNLSLYQCKKPDLPIYVFAGEDDPCIGGKKGFEDSIQRLRNAGYKHIDTKLFTHMRHEVLHEDNSLEAMQAVVTWIKKNIH